MKIKKVFQSLLCSAFLVGYSSVGAVSLSRPAPVIELDGGLQLRLSLDSRFEFDRSNFVALKGISLRPDQVDQLLVHLKLPGLKSEQLLSNGRLAVFTLARLELVKGEDRFEFERMNLRADFVAHTTPLDFVRLCDLATESTHTMFDLRAVYQVSQDGVALPLQSRRYANLGARLLEDSRTMLLNFPKELSFSGSELIKVESKVYDLRLENSEARRFELAMSDFCEARIERSVLESELCQALVDDRVWHSVRLRIFFLDEFETLRAVSWDQIALFSDCRMSMNSGRPVCDYWTQPKSLSRMRAERGFDAFDSIVARQSGQVHLGGFFHFIGSATEEDSLIELSVPRFTSLGFR